jgi:hypothetical protein
MKIKKRTQLSISMTDFIEFVNKNGTRKQTLVRTIKRRDNYSPEFDFWKKLRERIVTYHRDNKPISYLDDILHSIQDYKKVLYPKLLLGYKKFLGRKNINWFTPPNVQFKIEGLTIRVNPELGLEIKSTKHIVKLYFKDDPLSKHEVDLLILLMKLAIDPNNIENYSYAVLEVNRSKMHIRTPDLNTLPLLEGEALNFVRIWEKSV